MSTTKLGRDRNGARLTAWALLRRRQSFDFSHAACDALSPSLPAHREVAQPLAEQTGFAVDRDWVRGVVYTYASLVCALFCYCSPVAVLRFVVAVVVAPFDRMLVRRAAPHVGKEVLELQPAFADRDAASTVVLERRVRRGIATSEHRRPRPVLDRFWLFAVAAVRGFAMSLRAFAERSAELASETAAAFRVSGPQRVPLYFYDFPTFAPADPHHLAVVPFARRVFHQQTPKVLPGEVYSP